MKVKDCMTKSVICVGQDEPASVAARLMARYNVGILPVRGKEGAITGVLTDCDIVLRCVAAEREGKNVLVKDIMSTRVCAVQPDTELSRAAGLMAAEQVRRLPVIEGGKLVGMLTLGDVTRNDQYSMEAAECFERICAGTSHWNEG